MSSVEVQAPFIKNWKKMIKKAVKPNTAKPATPNPITVPPPKDTFNACGKLVRAACVVLTFVFVAIFIPIFPAKAEKNAPTIIFIEEISGLFPSRDSDAHEMSKNAVDAMLAEMDRTGERGIFVLCATNYPERIDSALLRAGRLDKKVYISPPDFEARKAMFELYLKSRPLDFGIDYNKLATLTENYVSSDIKDLIVDGASRQALKMKSRISMSILEEIISNTKPSVPIQELKKYELMKAKMDGVVIEKKNDRPRVGF